LILKHENALKDVTFPKVGKRNVKLINAASRVSGKASPRMFNVEKKTLLEFLIDCGSNVSILPSWFIKKPQIKIRHSLIAVNGGRIKTTGMHQLSLDFGFGKTIPWTFIVADVNSPILGADFLQACHLVPDLTNRKLIDGKMQSSVSCSTRNSPQPSIQLVTDTENLNPQVRELLLKYPSLCKPPQYHEEPKHAMVHHIVTEGPPHHSKSRRLPPKLCA